MMRKMALQVLTYAVLARLGLGLVVFQPADASQVGSVYTQRGSVGRTRKRIPKTIGLVTDVFASPYYKPYDYVRVEERAAIGGWWASAGKGFR